MGKTRSKTQQIQIMVMKDQIELGEKYACSLSLDSQVEWRCEHPFAVRFDWDAPLEVQSKEKNSLAMRFRVGACLMPNHPYRYMIAVFSKGQVITTVGVIIVKPPRPEPAPPVRHFMPPLPGIIIVKPPRP